jgi:hemerythrin-like metal-binding protein
METFAWDNHFLTGFATVDAQHQGLFDLINHIGTLLGEDKAATEQLDAVFRELAAYAATHFKEEERLMHEAAIDNAYFVQHAKIHHDFVAQLKAMWAQRGIMSAPAETIHGFLAAWLSSHILGDDQEMARRLRAARGEPRDTLPHDEYYAAATPVLQQALRVLHRELSHLNQDLAESNRRLEETVAQRTQALAVANEQLQREQGELTQLLKQVQETQGQLLQSEKMASIGQLAAGVAHEINNPIGFVNSNLGTLSRYVEDLLLLADLGAATPEGQALKQQIDLDYLRTDLADLLRESRDGLDRVRKIIVNLKDFSRIDQAEWQEADLLAGLESTLNVVWHELKYKAEIVRELRPLPLVRCVPAQINQVFMNLLVNAAQAIPQHGTITLRSGTEDGWTWVEIADNGCGMDETTQRRIFEPFFTTKPVGTGTGLGMSVTWDIVTKHRGRFDIESAVGRGTRIRVWLPICGPTDVSQKS